MSAKTSLRSDGVVTVVVTVVLLCRTNKTYSVTTVTTLYLISIRARFFVPGGPPYLIKYLSTLLVGGSEKFRRIGFYKLLVLVVTVVTLRSFAVQNDKTASLLASLQWHHRSDGGIHD